MKYHCLILFSLISGYVSAEYVGNGNGNGNGNAYGVPSGSFTPPPPQGPSGPYPPSGWKPSGRRLLLPGEGRQNGIDSGFGQPLPAEYGPSIDSQYGPSVDNQYIPTNGGNGNGHNGNGNGNNGNGNGHNGNGNGHNGNGNGHNGNGNGHNGNGNGHNGNGNGHNGNGNGLNGNGNGHNGNGNGHNGNGNGHNGNGNGHNGNGNGHNGNGNGHNGNGNGHNGNGNGHNGNGNGFGNGNGDNAHGDNGFANGNGLDNGFANGNGNGKIPSFHGAFPNQGFGLTYPFLQLSVPATVTATRLGKVSGSENVHPVYQLSTSYPSGSGLYSNLISGTALSTYPVAQTSNYPVQSIATPGLYSFTQIPFGTSQALRNTYPSVVSSASSLYGSGFGQQYTFLPSAFNQKSNFFAVRRR